MTRRDHTGTKIVYKITYPNGKMYIGMDLTNSINDFGGASDILIARDFTSEQRRVFTITREVLWQSDRASDRAVRATEVAFIPNLRANDPAVGYNRSPGWAPRGEVAHGCAVP